MLGSDIFTRSAQRLIIDHAGNAAYAATIVSLIDPDGIYFSGRVIAQGAERQEDMRADLPKTLERELEGREPITLIIDDTSIVWKSHPRNLLAVERYFYFPSLRAPPPAGVKGRTLLERNMWVVLDGCLQ